MCTLVCLASYIQYYVWGIELNKGVDYKIRPLQFRYLSQYQAWLIISWIRLKAVRNLGEGRKGIRIFCMAHRIFLCILDICFLDKTIGSVVKQPACCFFWTLWVTLSTEEWLYYGTFICQCYGLNVAPNQDSYVEALTPSVAILRDGTSKEVIKVKWGPKSGVLI